MAGSGVIATPDDALARITAVETPIQLERPGDMTGLLPKVVPLALAVIFLVALGLSVPSLIAGSALGLSRQSTPFYTQQ